VTDADNDGEPIAADVAAILTEVQSALAAANMSHITAAADGNKIQLTNALGGEISVVNFKSDGTGTMTAQPKVGQGVGKILDDNGASGSASAVNSIDVLSSETSQTAIATLDRALGNVASERASLGAMVNRLDHTINNLSNVSTNTAAAKSQIVDADFAAETSALTKTQILSQAATSMLAQANQSKQSILALLQG
jgi:flagellin